MKSAILVAVAGCAFAQEAGTDAERNLLRDPGFETGSPSWMQVFPEDQKETVSLGIDRETKRTGEASAFVADTDGSVWAFHNWSQYLPQAPKGKWLELSAWLKLEGVRYTAQLAVQCWDAEAKKTVAWASSADRAKVLGTADWQRHAVRLLVPESTSAVWVRIGLTGPGKVWIDDVAATVVKGALPLTSLQIAVGANAVLNPGFEEQKPGLFTHWIPYRYRDPEGQVELTRDTMIVHSGTACARILNRNWMNRELQCWAQAIAPAPLGRTVVLHGFVKTQSVEGTAGLMLQCFDGPTVATPKLLAEISTHDTQTIQGDTDWTLVSAKLTVPPGTAQLWVRAFLRGPGTAWFDDVQLVVQ